MKKGLIIYLVLALVLINSVNAQSNDTVNIRALVKQQILAAQEKSKKQSIKLQQQSVTPVEQQNLAETNTGFPALFWKLGILIAASLVAVGFVIKRRLKFKKIEGRLKLKKNIKAIREEQLVKEIDPRLKSIRKRLCLTSNYLNKPEKEVIFAAKNMRLAKEELMLASRLRKYRVNDKMEVTV